MSARDPDRPAMGHDGQLNEADVLGRGWGLDLDWLAPTTTHAAAEGVSCP